MKTWDAVSSAARRGDGDSLAALAEQYVVVAFPLKLLPAASQRLGIRPFAAPDQNSPLLVVARPDGRQLAAVTTWNKTPLLTRDLALGLVQTAKEQPHSRGQLDRLLALVEPVDRQLADEVRRCSVLKVAGPAGDSPRGTGQHAMLTGDAGHKKSRPNIDL